ncbi:MAG: type IV secretory system conjugative DNA transfer family protein, partial [Flavobacterium sp.]|nr:type IV secretory system conjugative DNA transfer family protein [Flavobacterium sp.]
MPNALNLGYRIENSDPESAVRIKGFSKAESPAPLINPNELITYNGSAHLMTVAPTGTGKGRSVVVPTLLTYPGSVVVMDPKGENYAITARARYDMGQQVIRLNPFDVLGSATDSFNFFDLFQLPNIDVET